MNVTTAKDSVGASPSRVPKPTRRSRRRDFGLLVARAGRDGEHARPGRGQGVGVTAPRRQHDGAALAVEGPLPRAHPVAQGGGALPDGGVLDEPRAELLLADGVVLRGDRLERRQEAARLQQDESRREPQERGGFLGRERAHGPDTPQVFLREIPEPDREDVQLALLDELEEEVERALEALDLDARRARADDGRVIAAAIGHGSASPSARWSRRSSSVSGGW